MRRIRLWLAGKLLPSDLAIVRRRGEHSTRLNDTEWDNLQWFLDRPARFDPKLAELVRRSLTPEDSA